jgi:hypothetical protein
LILAASAGGVAEVADKIRAIRRVSQHFIPFTRQGDSSLSQNGQA